MLTLKSLALLAALAGQAALAHMELAYPPDLRSKSNPYAGSNVDYSLTSPLSGSSQYPCKGETSLLSTPQGTPVASWAAGDTVNMTITGGAPHGGGSCQASLSFDGGKTFTVVHTWIGGCPAPQGQTSSFKFSIPADVPAAKQALFSWTWFNNIGNREMYQGCAAVSISAGAGGGSEKVKFADRPQPFLANIGNGCATQNGDVQIPNPGPDVDNNSAGALPPTGSCGASAPAGSGGSGGSSSSSTSSSSSGGSGGASGNPGGSPASPSGSGTPGGPPNFQTTSPSAGGAGSSGSSFSSSPNAELGSGSGSGSSSSAGSGSSPGTGSNSGSSPESSEVPENSCLMSAAGCQFTPGNSWPSGFTGSAAMKSLDNTLLAASLAVALLPALFSWV